MTEEHEDYLAEGWIRVVNEEKPKPLKMGPKYYEKPVHERLDYVMKLAASLNHGLDLMQKERNELLRENDNLLRQLEQKEQELEGARNIYTGLTERLNSQNQENIQKHAAFAAKITELQAQLSEQE